jgi:NAD(P)H dehydrogenase (quinone)
MIIAVTAVTGHLGAEIVNATAPLVGHEHIIGIARNPAKVKDLDIEVRKADYNSRSEFEHALVEVNTLLLVSGMDAPDKRIEQHRNVIAVAAGVKKIVYRTRCRRACR